MEVLRQRSNQLNYTPALKVNPLQLLCIPQADVRSSNFLKNVVTVQSSGMTRRSGRSDS
jgi:hypothetical protein